MSPAQRLTFGPLALDISPLRTPGHKAGRDMVTLTATVATESSTATMESLAIELQDLIAYRRRLRKFAAQEDEGAISLQVGLPHFDISLVARYDDTIRGEIRISPDIRGERHIYDFDATFEEVAIFATALDLSLLSLSLS